MTRKDTSMQPALTSILVSVTEGCHVGCQHYGFIGSTREREANASEPTDWVRQASINGVPMIIFTGKEAFERFDVLKSGVAAAREAGASASMFTCSFWATSFDEALGLLRRLEGTTRL